MYVLLTICLVSSRINTLYAGLPPHQPRDFFRLFLAALDVSLHYENAELAHIPAEGACVLVANHPFGMVEGIALGALLAQVRPDFKFLGNFLLDRVPDMVPFNIPVDPFNGHGAQQRNIAPLRATMRWLADGGALVLFPAGEVAHYQLRRRGISDPPWQENLVRVLRRAQAPVLPVFFAGANSLRFHLLGLLHPRLRTVLLGTELVNKAGKTLHIRIGTPIPAARLADFPDDTELLAYLRTATYALATSPAPGWSEDDLHTPAPLPAAPAAAAPGLPAIISLEPIAPPEPSAWFNAEIATLPAEALLCSCGEFQVYAADAVQIPHLLREIGRQREISFRQVGEGTGTALDLDRFDQYYQHLFLWNREKCELVGAYRLGKTDVIVRQYGIGGLYTSTLFRYDASLLEHTGPMLELGRSFIRPEYQRSHSALYLLWRGIGLCVVRNPRYRFLFGAVSISDEYSTMSRQLMTTFLTANHWHDDLTSCVSPLYPIERAASEPYAPVQPGRDCGCGRAFHARAGSGTRTTRDSHPVKTLLAPGRTLVRLQYRSQLQQRDRWPHPGRSA